jgi:putative FmdB family regulatory protein
LVLPFTFGNFGDSGNPVALLQRLIPHSNLAYNNDAATILTEPSDMPIFEYVCQQCNHQFEAIVLGTQKAACPKCESKRLSQQLSSFAVGGEKSREPAGPSGGACGSCGDPRGPGACSMN